MTSPYCETTRGKRAYLGEVMNHAEVTSSREVSYLTATCRKYVPPEKPSVEVGALLQSNGPEPPLAHLDASFEGFRLVISLEDFGSLVQCVLSHARGKASCRRVAALTAPLTADLVLEKVF
ncbi:hypothetical protein Salat_0652000 [Sesamum alatum]|uniref:Uncharacterized protein n=1 Tax=Sesamum alatum TaxID=300844 RepID=A0AAE1YRI0_9LAMI|nr:hypothetical protein Salat_0652000 [Sesamum alatum]